MKYFVCEDCKLMVDLPDVDFVSRITKLEKKEAKKAIDAIKTIRKYGLMDSLPVEEWKVAALEDVLHLAFEHTGHRCWFHDDEGDMKTEDLPWFKRWTFDTGKLGEGGLEPEPVFKDEWDVNLSTGEAIEGNNQDNRIHKEVK